jgi:transposase InsO family protein
LGDRPAGAEQGCQCPLADVRRCELRDRSRFATRTQARVAVFDYLEGLYNRIRRHSTLGYLPDRGNFNQLGALARRSDASCWNAWTARNARHSLWSQ